MTNLLTFEQCVESLDQAVKAARVPHSTVLGYLQVNRSTYWQWQQGRYPMHPHLVAKQLYAHAQELNKLVEDGVLGVVKSAPGLTKRLNKKRYKEYFQ